MQIRQTNLLADYSYSIFAMLTTHETLVRFDSDLRPVPQLARTWNTSPDARKWVFHLTQEARWHDGKPVTPDDVKFTFEYMASHHSASAWLNDLISRIHINGSRVTFVLTKPYSRFLINVGFIIRILPEHIWQHVENPLMPGDANVVSGCGPFVFDHFDARGKKVSFHRNTAYYGKKPSVETLEFYTYSTFDALSLALIRGDIDMYYKYASGFPPPYLPRLVQDSSVQLMYGDSMGIPAALGFNLHKHPVANPDIRKALALAINYEKISQSLLGNTGKIPSAGFVPPAVPFHLGQAPLVFSPEQSRKTFSTAGFVDTDNDGRINSPEGINLSLKLLARSDLEGTDAILQILTHNFKQVGVDLTIDRVDLSTWITRLNEDRHDLVLFRTTPWGMVMDAGCGSGYFDSRRNGGATLANIEDPIFHALCDRVLENTNPETEQALYHEIQRYYAKHLPAVALSWAVNAYPLSNRLQNPVVNPIEGGLANREAFSQLLFSSDY